jgi:mercuric reductase
MSLDFQALIAQKDEVIHDYRDKKYQSIVGDFDKIRVFRGEASFTGARQVTIGEHILTGAALVATGTTPNV